MIEPRRFVAEGLRKAERNLARVYRQFTRGFAAERLLIRAGQNVADWQRAAGAQAGAERRELAGVCEGVTRKPRALARLCEAATSRAEAGRAA